jgi:hypothetical protein
MSMSNTENRSRIYAAKPAASSLPRRRSVLFWMDSGESVQSPNSAVARESIPICTTAGARTFWRPVRSDCRAIPCEKPIQMR